MQRIGNPDLPLSPFIINAALLEVDLHLQTHGKTMSEFSQMPQPDHNTSEAPSHLELEELSYDREALQRRVIEGEKILNESQLSIWNAINEALIDIKNPRSPSKVVK